MIYTITLNPALDHFVEVGDLKVDDANRVSTECLYAGGKGIDVSRAIRHLGGDSMALGFIGGHNGQVMVDLLKAEGVTSYFTPIAQETRRNIIVSARARGTQTILNSMGPVVTADEWQEFLIHLRLLDLRDAYVVPCGSLPRGVPQDAYRPDAEILGAAENLNRSGVKMVIVSCGRRGILAVSGSERYRAVPPAVKVRSTVGAGDSAVAGFVFRHAGGKAFEDCVRFATAAGTAATLAPGNQLCRLRDVQRLVPRIRVEAMNKRHDVR